MSLSSRATRNTRYVHTLPSIRNHDLDVIGLWMLGKQKYKTRKTARTDTDVTLGDDELLEAAEPCYEVFQSGRRAQDEVAT